MLVIITNFPNDINEVLEAYVRNNSTATAPVDTPISKIDRSAYSAIANKLSKGTPSQYYVDRTTAPSIFLYQTPSSSFSGSSYLLKFYYLKRIQDVGAYTNQGRCCLSIYSLYVRRTSLLFKFKNSSGENTKFKIII